MGCTVVVGGQFGSEGKGKVTALLASSLSEPWVVRCGGPNSGHRTKAGDQELVLRQVPAGVANSNSLLLLSAGSIIDEDVLVDESDLLGIPQHRLVVDPNAILIEPEDREREKSALRRIASTLTGTGSAVMRRIARDGHARFAADSSRLRARLRVESVADLLRDRLDLGGDVVVEGTQGFGLSLLHGQAYPYVTSRDTTAAGFISEVGLSPRDVSDVVLVVRTFPIRVGGPSGPLTGEISWEEIQRRSGAPEVIPEYTSVTQRLRRVAEFDMESIRVACRYNRPTLLAVMGLDRRDYADYGASSRDGLSLGALRFISSVESQTGVPVGWVGTGFATTEAIDLRLTKDAARAATAG